jgi:hypothetical protein
LKRNADADANKGEVISAEDFRNLSVLWDEQLGIFHGIAPKDLEHVRIKCTRELFNRGELIFKQDKRTDNLGIHVVISGRFEVTHVLDIGRLLVSIDEAGTLIGENEAFIPDVDNKNTLTGRKGLTRAEVKCVEAGETLHIFPPSILFNQDKEDDLQTAYAKLRTSLIIALNINKATCAKLLRRHAWLDPAALLGKQERVFRAIADLIKIKFEHSTVPTRENVVLEITQSQIGHALSIGMSTLSTCKRILVNRGCTWEKALLPGDDAQEATEKQKKRRPRAATLLVLPPKVVGILLIDPDSLVVSLPPQDENGDKKPSSRKKSTRDPGKDGGTNTEGNT